MNKTEAREFLARAVVRDICEAGVVEIDPERVEIGTYPIGSAFNFGIHRNKGGEVIQIQLTISHQMFDSLSLLQAAIQTALLQIEGILEKKVEEVRPEIQKADERPRAAWMAAKALEILIEKAGGRKARAILNESLNKGVFVQNCGRFGIECRFASALWNFSNAMDEEREDD